MTIPATIGRNIGELTDYLGGVSRYEAPINPTYTVRGVPMTDADLKQLSAVLFGEISNRDPQKQALEAETIANTALNRVGQYQARGGKFAGYGLENVLTEPNQYQAYGGGEYKRYLAGSTTPVDQQKINAIDSTISKIRSGTFPDTTGGRVFYAHDPSGKLWLKDGGLFKAATPSRTMADLSP